MFVKIFISLLQLIKCEETDIEKVKNTDQKEENGVDDTKTYYCLEKKNAMRRRKKRDLENQISNCETNLKDITEKVEKLECQVEKILRFERILAYLDKNFDEIIKEIEKEEGKTDK